MIVFCALRAKAYAYRFDDTEMKKAKGTKKCIVKRELTFKNYADCFINDEVIIKPQQIFRSDHHRVYTEEVNKIVWNSNDNKRLQTFDKVTTYPYGTSAIKVCELAINEKAKQLLCTIDQWIICNIWVAIRTKICHKTLEGISKAKI